MPQINRCPWPCRAGPNQSPGRGFLWPFRREDGESETEVQPAPLAGGAAAEETAVVVVVEAVSVTVMVTVTVAVAEEMAEASHGGISAI